MQLFRNLRLTAQIMSIILLAMLFLLVVGLTGFYFNRQASASLGNMYTNHLQSIDLIQEARGYVRGNQELCLKAIVAPPERDRALKEISDNVKKIDDSLSIYEKTQLDQFEKDKLAAFKIANDKVRASRKEIVDSVLAGKAREAIAVYTTKYIENMNTAQKLLRELVDYKIEQAREANTRNEQNAVISHYIISGITLLGVALCAGLGYWISRSIAKPVGIVTSALAEVAKGNLNVRDLDIETTNEIGKLATALNTMKNNLSSLVYQIQSSAQQVTASSEGLTAIAEQSTQAANMVAGSINSVANGANEQMAAADETSVVVAQMSAGIQQVAANTNQVAEQSAKAAEKAQNGGQTIETAVSQMVHIEDTVNTSANIVAKLGERSKEIGQIVDAISSIAGQTNLLALNAAIEAARAGEQGRGFAVVAEEVRKLAEQSQEAAKKIAELIGEIQGDTDKAVAAMNDGTREVKTGTEAVNAAGMAFREIVDLVSQVSSQFREISTASQQMASGSQQIFDSVKKINSLSKTSAGEAQSVSTATEEQLASMEEIASHSEVLSKLAHELQVTVAKFRVKL